MLLFILNDWFSYEFLFIVLNNGKHESTSNLPQPISSATNGNSGNNVVNQANNPNNNSSVF